MLQINRAIAHLMMVIPFLAIQAASISIFGYGILSFVLTYAVVLFVVILIHELGHAATARMFHWPVLSIAVFPVVYKTRSRKFAFWTAASGDVGGLVTVGAGGLPQTRARRIWLAAGGPIANLALTAVIVPIQLLSISNSGHAALGAVAVTSLFIGLANLLPWRAGNGARSDGSTILSLLMAMYQSRKR